MLGKYRAVGRIIHAKYLKERLVLKSPAFDGKETKEGVALVDQLEILADTLYIQVKFHIEQTVLTCCLLYCIVFYHYSSLPYPPIPIVSYTVLSHAFFLFSNYEDVTEIC